MAAEKSRVRRGRVVCVGIAPWGVVDVRRALEKRNQVVSFHSMIAPRAKMATLNNR
jgi:transient receptor potential cation channel subfamily M protein 3